MQGDLVLAEPAAQRIAAALAAARGCEVATHRRPAALSSILDDLRTFSLFASGKVTVVVDSAALADRSAAGDLIDDAQEALPLASPADRALTARERTAASRLLQVLTLFGIDPAAGPAPAALEALPAWVFEGGQAQRRGGKRARGKRQVEDLREGLQQLLEAARREELRPAGGGELADLASAIRDGLPAGHTLVLAERSAGAEHPVVQQLSESRAFARVGELASGRGGAWEGIDLLAAELEQQTGVAIASDALNELARRTLRQDDDGKRGSSGAVDADSTARFAGEYRKLAQLATGKIDRRLVQQAVEDRGEEDVWQLMDAIAQGKAGEALDRLGRLLGVAEDPLAERLSFFALFAQFCRQLTALRGMMRVSRVPAGESSYPRFKDRLAPALQGTLDTGGKNPLAGLHPFRLHRAYLAASRMPEPFLARLPADLLETELRLKGESSDADTALAHLVSRIALAARGK